MADVSGGPGWWQASDGRWYPPDVLPEPPKPKVAEGSPDRNDSSLHDGSDESKPDGAKRRRPTLRSAAVVVVGLLVVAVVVGAGLDRRQADSSAYADGYDIASVQGTQTSLQGMGGATAVTPTQACSRMAITEKATGDGTGSWESGCEAGLAKWEAAQMKQRAAAAIKRETMCSALRKVLATSKFEATNPTAWGIAVNTYTAYCVS